jgi:hypothetical protein
MVVGWETTSLASVVVSRVVSAVVQVDLGLVVGIEGLEKSVPWAFLLFLTILVIFVLGVILLEHLLVHNWIIPSPLLDHSSLWL